MVHSRRAPLALAFAMVLAVGAVPAAAQEISAGWRLLEVEDTTLKKGWYFDAAVPLTEFVSAVGEVGGSYTSENDVRIVSGRIVPVDSAFSITTFAGGVRLRAPFRLPAPFGAIVPFGQAMFGAGRQAVSVEGSVTVPGGTLNVDDDDSETDPILDFGGGVNFMVTENLGVRVGLGWMRFYRGEDNDNTVFRFALGAVLGF